MKNQVIDILEDINPGVDHEARVDLDRFALHRFADDDRLRGRARRCIRRRDTPVEIVPDNFNSVEAVCSLMARLRQSGLSLRESLE